MPFLSLLLLLLLKTCCTWKVAILRSFGELACGTRVCAKHSSAVWVPKLTGLPKQQRPPRTSTQSYLLCYRFHVWLQKPRQDTGWSTWAISLSVFGDPQNSHPAVSVAPAPNLYPEPFTCKRVAPKESCDDHLDLCTLFCIRQDINPQHISLLVKSFCLLSGSSFLRSIKSRAKSLGHTEQL